MTPSEAVAAAEPIALAILPPNASAIERAILTAEIARLAAVDPTVIVTIWNAETCPAALLPWLAQGVSVDVWSNDWSEAQKRAVVAASPGIHRIKGTLGAVRRALAAFDLDTKIIEWWQDGSRRGTFKIEIVYQNNGPIFDIATQGFAIQSVSAAKPKSRVFTTISVLRARGPLYVGALARSALTAVAHPYQFSGSTLRASDYVGATAASFLSATAHRKV